MGKSHAGGRVVRFSSRKAATKVGKDCRARGSGRAGNKAGNNAEKNNAGTGGKATLENEW